MMQSIYFTSLKVCVKIESVKIFFYLNWSNSLRKSIRIYVENVIKIEGCNVDRPNQQIVSKGIHTYFPEIKIFQRKKIETTQVSFCLFRVLCQKYCTYHIKRKGAKQFLAPTIDDGNESHSTLSRIRKNQPFSLLS